MKNSKLFLKLICSLFVLFSCSVTERIEKGVKYSIQAGMNHGGIIENTDLAVVPNIENEVDAFSGATSMGANTGVHVNIPLKRNEIETGLDYMYNSQSFKYADAGNSFSGTRDLSVSQVLVPLTYNFVLLKRLLPDSELQFHLGYVGQLNFISVSGSGKLPNYNINTWSNGATIGFSAYPFLFKNGHKLGFYLDVYRGSRFYEDYYNQKSFDMPGSSYFKFGLKYRFK